LNKDFDGDFSWSNKDFNGDIEILSWGFFIGDTFRYMENSMEIWGFHYGDFPGVIENLMKIWRFLYEDFHEETLLFY
jgi:hypothetical protein